jgi:hypothetical protein
MLIFSKQTCKSSARYFSFVTNQKTNISCITSISKILLRAMSSDDQHIPEARKTGHMPGHIKARPPFGKQNGATGGTAQEEAARRFFATPNFAVAGASAEPHKFGFKSMNICATSALHLRM